MIHCARPELLLLLPLLLWLLVARPRVHALLAIVRTLLLAAVVLLLAEPYWPGADDGRDVVVVLDRSRSMPAGVATATAERVLEVQQRQRGGDRLGLVAFGRTAVVESPPVADFRWPQAPRDPGVDGTDLGAAIGAALSLIPPGRHGSLLVVSDGAPTGGDAEAAARACLRAGIRIDAIATAGAPGHDAAIADVTGPGEVATDAPFVLTATVVADRDGPAAWRLLRDGEVVGSGRTELHKGTASLQFAAALATPGVHTFAVEVAQDGDVEPQNGRGLCAVRAAAPPVVVCVTPDGREDRLTRSLRAAGLAVAVHAPQTAPLGLDALDAVRCVVLENVPAQDLPHGALPALATFVRDLGGGLLMTGGAASFGVGGYHRSPVEAVLPVTMELREEQRRFALSMAIALDRSGSMGAPAGSGTKMDLANAGAAAAVELLNPLDAVAVLAVDSAAHEVVPLQPVVDKGGIVARIRGIESGGGGIYVGAALQAAAEQLARATSARKHIVLFADAADAEEPLDYRTFVPELVASGTTVSVIGLGSKTDSDAKLLEEIARLGEGRCQFVAAPEDLPRVFAQETIQVAKSALVEQPTGVAVLPGLQAIGAMPGTFSGVGGYSLAWARPRAEVGLRTTDEQAAALLSHWQCGLGRAAAFLGEADGALSGELASYDDYGAFFATLVRWLEGGQASGLQATFRREHGDAVLEVEAEPQQIEQLEGVRGVVVAPDGSAIDVAFERSSATLLRARLPLASEGLYRAAVQAGNASLRVPPVCLPYSPELAPQRDRDAGPRLLRRLCALTGGVFEPLAATAADGERRSRGQRDLGPWCALLAVVLLLAEIAVRRLDLRLPQRRAAAATDAVPVPAAAPPPQPLPKAAAPAPPKPPAPPANDTLTALAKAQRKRRPPGS